MENLIEKETKDELRIYNTLDRKTENFKPEKEGHVRMYVCGPTVNDVPHLGHARQQITFDILRRYLKFSGYRVTYASNITDIDDKIINKANELSEDIMTFTERNLKEHLEDYEKIGVQRPDIQSRATQFVGKMVELVRKIEKKGYTYVIPGDGVYYDISKFKEYGKLSHQKLENLIAGKRIAIKDKKRNKGDFVVWKFSKEGEPSWKSPWGNGRPGWHIECSAMSESILGLPLDIHGGGQDLIFPHHEDEIAQSQAAYGKHLANYWVHNGMVNINKVKMSKSLGNFTTIRDLLKTYKGEEIRLFILSSNYRKPIDFSEESLNDAKNSYERLKNIVLEIKDDGHKNVRYLDYFKKAMNNDLNTPQALAVIWNLLRDEKADGKYRTIAKIDEVLGLNLFKKEKLEIPKEIENIAKEREKARKNSDWKKSDELREKLKQIGWQIDDTLNGSKLKRI